MKKLLFLIALTGTLTACEAPAVYESTGKQFTFSLDYGFRQTRALESDGKSMTDVWIFDYDDEGTLLQQLHQSDTDDDFGSPTITLPIGSHNLFFIASRGVFPSVDASTKTILFQKVRDTFWKSLYIDVENGGIENRNVSLDRVVTKLKLVLEDAIPAGTANINIIPKTWYYGINYQTGAPASLQTDETITIDIPSSSIGKIGEAVSIFGFSATTEWTTDISVTSMDAEDNIIGRADITGAPFIRNRKSEYTGHLWQSNNGFNLSLNAEWLDNYNGTW